MANFTSDENKGLLWNLLYEGGVFHGITSDKATDVRETLDSVVAETWQRKREEDDLTDLNKQVCQMMLVAAERLREGRIVSTGEVLSTSTDLSANNLHVPVTSAERSQHRQAEFTDAFTKRQAEFSNLMHDPPPATIDFSDQSDEPLGPLDDALKRLEESRSRELNRVLESQREYQTTQAQSTQAQSSWENLTLAPKRLNIDDSTVNVTKDIQIIDEKKVRFDETSEPNESMDFISKLKIHKPAESSSVESSSAESSSINDNIENKLVELEKQMEKIYKGQKTIISMLSQLIAQ